MLDKFWESIGENLASEWFKHLFSPSLLFWGYGLAAYILKIGWGNFIAHADKISVANQWLWIIGLLVVLVLSSLIAKNFRFKILRLLEGYWGGLFENATNFIAKWTYWLFEKKEKKWNALKARENSLSRNEYRELSSLETILRYYPTSPNEFQPTKLGNILRSSELSSINKFGLDVTIIWPRLWLILPENARNDLIEARQSMMNYVELWLLGALSLVWLFFYPWLLPISVLWIFFSYSWLLDAAKVYSDLLESVFEIYRWELYHALHWPLPHESGENEIQHGKKLTEYIWRGTIDKPISYIKQ